MDPPKKPRVELNKKQFWQFINRETKKYGLTVNDFKTRPHLLYMKSEYFRTWANRNITEPTKWPLKNGRTYNFIEAIHTDFPAADVDAILQTAPSNWTDSIISQREISEQRQTMDALNDADVNSLLAEMDVDEPMPSTSTDTVTKPSTSSQPSVASKFPKTKTNVGQDPNSKSKKRPAGTEHQDSPQKGKAFKKATSITGQQTTDLPPQSNPVGSQQVDTDRGPEHNTGGTLQGEAGNRHVQKKSSKFGLIEVMATVTKAYFFGFVSVAKAENFHKLLNIIYPSAKIFAFEYKEKLPSATRSIFFTVMKLNFNIGYKTLYNKFGNALDKLIYFYHVNFAWEDDDIVTATKEARELIQLHLCNNIPSLDWEILITAEENRSNYRKPEKATTKKLVWFTDESTKN